MFHHTNLASVESPLRNPAFALVSALVATLLVLISPLAEPSSAAYTSVAPGVITYNDQVCNLGDPANHLSSETAFEISTADQLWEVTDCVSTSATVFFKLANDIDVSSAASAPTQSPIGFSSSGEISFSGVLDGQNNVISGIAMSTSSYGVGLFAYLHNSTISNLVVSGSFEITAALPDQVTNSAGALAVRSAGNLDISSVSNLASISARWNVGGLVGYAANDVNFSNVVNAGVIFSTAGQVGGLVGYVAGDANVTASSNVGTVTGRDQVGGLVGLVWEEANVFSVSNQGAVTGTNRVGGLFGRVENKDANIVFSQNAGEVNGNNEVGGFIGYMRIGEAFISSSFNVATVSATQQYVGGLVGFVFSTGTDIRNSFNSGLISGANHAGGLIGYKRSTNAKINSSFNTGPVSSSGVSGGLIGTLDQGSIAIEFFYNTGVISGIAASDGMVGSAGITANTISAYSSVPSSYVSTTAIEDMRTASTFVGFDFENTWGFGAPTDNQGLPMLRSLAQISNYYSDFAKLSSNSALASLAISQGGLSPTFASATTNYVVSLSNDVSALTLTPITSDSSASIIVEGSAVASGNASAAIILVVGSNTITILITAADSTTTSYTLTVFRSNPPSESEPEDESRPVVYLGPVLNGPMETHAGALVIFSGRRLETITSAHVQDTQITIVLSSPESLVLELPSSISPGNHDLTLQSSFGLLTFQKGLRVLENANTTIASETLDKKLTIASFRGFIAIYTKGYEGQRLSAKVAGKWLVVESLDESFRGNDHSRTVRRTGSGFSIKVHLYIDREFVRTEELTTR